MLTSDSNNNVTIINIFTINNTVNHVLIEAAMQNILSEIALH